MKFNIYTHGDFDGVVSGAILYDLFTRCEFTPGKISFVEYSTYPPEIWEKFEFPASDINCVTDFPFSPALERSSFYVWSDHHQNRDVSLTSDKGVHYYDPNAPSCAAVLSPLAEPNPLLSQLVPWATMVDSAKYESPRQAVLMQEPPLRIAVAVTQMFQNTSYRAHLVKSLGKEPVEKLVCDPRVEDAYKRYTWKQMKAIEFLENNLVTYSRWGFKVGICSFVGFRFSSRYAAFLVNPDIDFLIYIRKIPPWDSDIVSMTISYNPWKKQEAEVSLVTVLKSVYDGDCGGHSRVAAAVFPTTGEALELSRKLAEAVCSTMADSVGAPF